MKKTVISIIAFLIAQITYSQASNQGYRPGDEPKNCLWGCPVPISLEVSNSKLIFEGRILSDSVFMIQPGTAVTYHHVLVLKEFKGNFITDTIDIVTLDGTMLYKDGGGFPMLAGSEKYAYIGDEAVFCLSDVMVHYNPDILMLGASGHGCGFVKVCDRKDVVSEVYEPIENATGQGYTDIHPNTCKTK